MGCVRNNRSRRDCPRYRCRGLPIGGAPAESVIEQIDRRVKGGEKFRLHGGAEALLHLRAAYRSADGGRSATGRARGRMHELRAADACDRWRRRNNGKAPVAGGGEAGKERAAAKRDSLHGRAGCFGGVVKSRPRWCSSA